MKFAEAISIGVGLISLPLSLYSSWLLYQHVQATDLMWFIWWINLPLLVAVSVASKFIRESK
jgi:hypothetical protein